ncbi:active regulator of SIRT1 isoform X1 [Rhinatrema bivittatum]|uniref:active regulator of SIRT1 isoform X1 n=2 Tax=Rhinatrema bivittatum TaxID=194408 RepID=UPI00112DC1CF|nr:active regulator of SIRT1 isoform X1 [Rhinatrema bivittatum]
MSASLLRKGLELLGAGEEAQGKDSGAKKGKKSPVAHGLELSSCKIGMKKRPRQQATVRGRRQNSASVKGRVIKSALDEYRKHQQKDQLQNNLQYMLGTTFVPDKQVKQQILSQNRGRKSIDRPTEKSKTKQKEKSVFSEADFLRFQREYFGGGVGGV